jgi:phosphatidylglycerol:prolipoprotein diacylglycerol transferase
MIPYFEVTSFSVFGISLYVWGLLVACGFLMGTAIAYRRAKEKKLNPQYILDLAGWIFIGAFIGARLFHVLAYQPAFFLEAPWRIVDLRIAGYSMAGGLIGGALTTWFYARHKQWSFEELVKYADVLAWGLPWGCGADALPIVPCPPFLQKVCIP